MAKESGDRSRAKRLRTKEKRGGTLTRAELRWLEKYEADTARWSNVDDDAPAAAAPAPAPSSVPTHVTEPIRGVGPDAFMAAATLPPAAADAPPGVGEAPASAADPGASGEASADAGAGGAAAAAPEPIIDPMAPAPAAPNVEGAKRFAALVVAYNAFGLKAMLEMFPPGSVPLPPEYDAMIRAPQAQTALLSTVEAAAVELAIKHPWLCNIAPTPSMIVLASTSVSSVALYFRHVKPLTSGKPAPIEVGPPQTKRAPAPAPVDDVVEAEAFDFSAVS